jgi:hypothetical protein
MEGMKRHMKVEGAKLMLARELPARLDNLGVLPNNVDAVVDHHAEGYPEWYEKCLRAIANAMEDRGEITDDDTENTKTALRYMIDRMYTSEILVTELMHFLRATIKKSED